MDFLYGCDQDVWKYRQGVGFSSPRMLNQVQHVYVIARGELMGVALKNGSFRQHGMDRVGFGSGIRWFMVL